MKKLFLVLLLASATAKAEGPLFRSTNTFTQQEFVNVYQDLRVLQNRTSLSISSVTVTSGTFTNLTVTTGTVTSLAVSTITVTSATIAGLTVSGQTILTGPTTSKANITFSPTTAGIVGTTTNDSACTGCVGEVVSANVSVQAMAATNVFLDAGSIALTAGDWAVTGQLMYVNNAATITDVWGAVSTTAGNVSTGITNGLNQMETVPPTSTANTTITIASYRLSLSGAGTAYLKAAATYSAGTPKVLGSIHAIRTR